MMINLASKLEKMAYSWTCPYCKRITSIDSNSYIRNIAHLQKENAHGEKQLQTDWVICPNDDCKKPSLYVSLYENNLIDKARQKWERGSLIKKWTLLPDTKSKVFPDYIPIGLRKDYEEAYSIVELSAKASATLARRCIEGMIQDFWGIKKTRLADAINELKDKIDPLVWKSIDGIRTIGNIGAHMEKDVNLIIDVEPDEAKFLIELIEMLFKEWYIQRHDREQRLNSIVEIANKKKAEKKTKTESASK